MIIRSTNHIATRTVCNRVTASSLCYGRIKASAQLIWQHVRTAVTRESFMQLLECTDCFRIRDIANTYIERFFLRFRLGLPIFLPIWYQTDGVPAVLPPRNVRRPVHLEYTKAASLFQLCDWNRWPLLCRSLWYCSGANLNIFIGYTKLLRNCCS